MQEIAAPLAGVGALGIDPIPVEWTTTGRGLEAPSKPKVEQTLEAGFIVREQATTRRSVVGCCGLLYSSGMRHRARPTYAKGIDATLEVITPPLTAASPPGNTRPLSAALPPACLNYALK